MWRMADSAPRARPGSLGHWPRQVSRGRGKRTQGMGQWPRYRVRLDRRTGDGRLPGRFGSRRKVPSGNSRYRLYTWTSPFRPRFPSITNLVPTGKRLGRRSEQYAMTPSCNVATLTLQCIELVTRCMIAAVIHVIPRVEPAKPTTRSCIDPLPSNPSGLAASHPT